MDAAELTLEEIVRDHYLPAISKRRRANTVNGYVSSLELHVLPRRARRMGLGQRGQHHHKGSRPLQPVWLGVVWATRVALLAAQHQQGCLGGRRCAVAAYIAEVDYQVGVFAGERGQGERRRPPARDGLHHPHGTGR